MRHFRTVHHGTDKLGLAALIEAFAIDQHTACSPFPGQPERGWAPGHWATRKAYIKSTGLGSPNNCDYSESDLSALLISDSAEL